MGAEEYKERMEKAGSFEIRIVSYKLGDRYVCKVDNVSPGAVISRAEGRTREEAEQTAVLAAKDEVSKTRVLR